jgi:hypothetical protein
VVGDADLAAGFGGVCAVALGQEAGGVSGAEVGGVAGLVDACDEVEFEGLQAGLLCDDRVEGGQLLAVAHRPDGSFAEDLHADNSSHPLRQFSNSGTPCFAGISRRSVIHRKVSGRQNQHRLV